MTSLPIIRAIGGAVGASIVVAAWLIRERLTRPGRGIFFEASGWGGAEWGLMLALVTAPILVAAAASYALARWRPLLGTLPLTLAVTAAAIPSGPLIYVLHLLLLGQLEPLRALPSWAQLVALGPERVGPWALAAGWVVFAMFDRMVVVAYQRVCIAK